MSFLLLQIKCLTLFVTHYPLVTELEEQHAAAVANFHMGYMSVTGAGQSLLDVV